MDIAVGHRSGGDQPLSAGTRPGRGVRLAVVVVVALLLLGPTVTGAPTPNATAAGDRPAIVGIYPNPIYSGDRGEFVVLTLPSDRDPLRLHLADGEDTVTISTNRSGRLAVATEPVARNLTDDPVVIADGPLQLANAGEWVALRNGERELDNVSYPQAPEGSRYMETATGWSWQRLGVSSFPVRSANETAARLLVLPDAPDAVLEPLRAADRRLWLAAYTFTSRRVVKVLCAAQRRGVDVRVLVERQPIDGITTAEAERLDRLTSCGVAVQLIGGDRARYTFHHPKYAIADDRVIVLTENWKPSGIGGRSNRGWGVVVHDPHVAAGLAETFETDASWRDTEPWSAVSQRRNVTRTGGAANGSYPAAVTPVSVSGVDVEVLLAPDNAEGRVVELLEGASRSIKVIQVGIGGRNQPFVRALIRAARRGVTVQLLLAEAWYVREQNREIADHLNGLAREADLPLRVRLVTPRGRFGKIHAKGAIVDGEHVLVGSLNWNNNSARDNREVALLLHGEAVGAYYTTVFNADWNGGQWEVPLGLPAIAAGLSLGAGVFARRSIEFDVPEDAPGLPAAPELPSLRAD